MPRAAPERAASERWIDELATLMAGGATRRFIVRAAELQIVEDRHGFLSTRAEPGIWTTGTVVLRYAEVSLYRLDADAGDLPTAVAPFPVEVIDGLGDEVDVRGEVGPGHGLVLLVDDEPVGCIGPAMPPPAVWRRRAHRLRR